MAYWLLKLGEQDIYPERPGETYRYDNTHSVRVREDDLFIYLDKRQGNYCFSGTGRIRRVAERAASMTDRRRNARVRTAFTACITDMVWFEPPLDIGTASGQGRRNRARLGVVNALAWGGSISGIDEGLYRSVLDMALEKQLLPEIQDDSKDSRDDSFGPGQIRKAQTFRHRVLQRHDYTCAVCGTRFSDSLVAAHLSPFCTDRRNRLNLANGICLCAFCHAALDKRRIAILPNGEIKIHPGVTDSMALEHFTRVDPSRRRAYLSGVGPQFIAVSLRLYDEAL